MKALLLLLSAVLLFVSCQNNPQPTTKKVLPNTPAEVAQQWVEAFYNDDFTTAVQLGTETTRMMIDSVKKKMEPNVAIIPFTISNMSCATKLDSAFCTYVYQEGTDRFEEDIKLLNVKEQWLVDDHWDDSFDMDLELDSLIKEEVERMVKELEEEEQTQQ